MSLMLNRSHSGSRGGEQFPDPFMDMASLYMPETIPDALKWCEFILMAQGIYWQALSRVAAYFITDVEIGGAARETKDKYKEFLEDQLGIKAIVQAVAMDYMVYGNSFTSVLMPFRRYLSCPQCGLEQPLRKIYNNSEFKFRWDFEFRANCPKCHYDGKWTHIDRRSGAADDIKVKRWNPHEMDLLWDPLTDSVDYIWKLSDDYRQLLRKGDVFHLEKASWEVVQAVKHNQAIMFDKDVVYHMKEEALAGIRNRGWGISRVLTNFRQAWYVQVLHRYNEAIALDYVIPFRVITPAPRTGTPYAEASDPIASMNLGNFTRYVTSMLRKRRRDPAAWNVLPFPVEYKALGGDATQLAPSELLELGIDTLLTSVGVPVEFYKGTLSLQSAPAALRLFEANWSHLCHNLNRFLAKLVKQVGILMSWEPVTAGSDEPIHAESI